VLGWALGRTPQPRGGIGGEYLSENGTLAGFVYPKDGWPSSKKS